MKRKLIFFILSSGVAFGSETIKNEIKNVANHAMSKLDENYFTLRKEYRQCSENPKKQAACEEFVNQKIKSSLKKDIRASMPIACAAAVVGMFYIMADNNAGKAIKYGYGAVAGLPIFVIEADAGLKFGHLVCDFFLR